mmetsp:Transcript_25296/g.38365  ORF Transcript_25296/g.38365 Transcript_25296/m.38365 type:complete len:143 (-) Transcript_25296:121-549(-)
MKGKIESVFLLFLTCVVVCYSFEMQAKSQKMLQYSRHQFTCTIRTQHLKSSNGDNENDDSNKIIDEFLDKPFFDPEDYDENDDSFLGRFANLVRDDYETAEFLYVGAVFIFLVILTQEVLRMQLYGDGYIPFSSGGGSGKLF